MRIMMNNDDDYGKWLFHGVECVETENDGGSIYNDIVNDIDGDDNC
jgi:hypothetical protein